MIIVSETQFLYEMCTDREIEEKRREGGVYTDADFSLHLCRFSYV
jgi:hypothetical protein